MLDSYQKDAKEKMKRSLEALRNDLAKLRTGRANTALLDAVRVDYYGALTPLNQLATLSVSDSRTIVIQPWDGSVIALIEKSIMQSDLGLNPMNDGKLIRVSLPALNEERRKDLVKVAKKHGEECKVSIRNIRRDINDQLKKAQKQGELTEDEEKKALDIMQKFTDDFSKLVDETVVHKEKDIMEV
ncbi:MAG: ribosome recycling factor [Deltaproteobacteria bacterium CG_4_10_14_0_2_um_filter_43_8]|nr:MAG: ribosome recycling factor [Deltaproteobacteria bacterium CG11_big_fil_rev_8_21_14_0_20_42_23]PJA18735.1 MAG: ribosome recycling factor [Deltaproteobacteria bacterium CG_4_10_14_0_2_um_filter_43_8]PJC64401.1 MAG: ribosome recycling factor [Deltaproteobacteria bacterium CG_4_9_14_0_2_um_filter_42_21]